DVIDKRRIERLLLLEERRDEPTDRGEQTPAQPAGRRRHIDLPRRVERRDLMLVRRRWRLRKIGGELLDRTIQPRQRVVIVAVGRVALGLEPREIIAQVLVTTGINVQRDPRPGCSRSRTSCAECGRTYRPGARRAPRASSPRPSPPGRARRRWPCSSARRRRRAPS